jgi:hypothetical protein
MSDHVVYVDRFKVAGGKLLVAETSIELMGPASETAKQLTAQYGGSLKTKLAGFGR